VDAVSSTEQNTNAAVVHIFQFRVDIYEEEEEEDHTKTNA